ncbi:TPA: ead/Ea22-like family protein [Escherichia coli]|uniref:ead/Ea22-like family protein n=1 Tax=Escherichia coli TaxID=562 RepID=UPI00098A79EA|nr:ead/Ea22-like family protein [Escherichia coli]DAJ01224.1 MAG TPA: Ead/Ea22-like protein [Caudoviricetes sp.]EFA3856716.1 ead/Ea22-like family protein [Escherichia coli]EFA3895318.1 ead/Ea22-like family protein [Escherichia coli]EFA7488849.1 ead/Ea22-like family protein [Escherichia coli]EFJ3327895.1 ead/Ea22-like family protein [Escherichia coli]
MTALNKQALRERYSPQPVPKCHICGAEMTVQRISASRITYGCTGATYDDAGGHYAEGRSIADYHYEQSRVIAVDVSDPDVVALMDELEAANELVELQRFKLERQAEDLHQAKSLESIHREKRLEVERDFRDYKDRAESNQMRMAKEICHLEDELQAAGIGVKGECQGGACE